MMSNDSGHSSDEEEEEEGEKVDEKIEDDSVKSAYDAGEKVLELERLASTDFNANVADKDVKIVDTRGQEEECGTNETGVIIEEVGQELSIVNNNETSNEAVDQITKGLAEDISLDTLEVNDNEGNFHKEIVLSNENEPDLVSQRKEDSALVETEKDEDEYPDGKNPFGDDEDDEELSPLAQANLAIVVNDTSEQKCVEKEKETSTNPFGSDLDSDEEEEAKCRQPSATTSSPGVSAANSSLNPFGSDLSDDEEAPSSPSPSVRS